MKNWDGKYLATLRKRVRPRMTQEELANMIGTTQTSITSWESGLHVPRANWLPMLATALGCEIKDLFREGE